MLHDDFLQLAEHLVQVDPSRPRAIHMRRAISSAYYAVFHRLIADAVRAILGNGPDVKSNNPHNPISIRVDQRAARWFNHKRMKTVSGWFEKPNEAPKQIQSLLRIGNDSFVPDDLRDLAGLFVGLQAQRHLADYDPGLRLTRTEVQEVVGRARDVFERCTTLAGDPMYRLYQLLLLTGDGIVTDRM